MRNTTAGLLGAMVLAATAAAADAQDSSGIERPQWTQTFALRARTVERPADELHGSWLALGGGVHLVATQPMPGSSGLRLNGLVADGGAGFSLALPERGPLVQLAPAAADSAFVLTGRDSEWEPATLRLIDSAGVQRWQQTLPEGGGDGGGRAKQLAAFADGGVLVLQERMLLAVTRSGVLQWRFYNGLDNQYLLKNAGVAFDPGSGTVWLAGSGGLRLAPDGNRVAAVRRFGANGTMLTLHTFLCSSCSESRATAIDILPDGEVVVVGRSGPGEPGFVAFYRADGAVRLRVDTPPGIGYDRLAHDADGAIYAFSRADNRVVALARDGSVLWQRDGADMAALEHGVLISQPFPRRPGALAVDAVGAGGQLLWTRQIEASDGLRVGGARWADGKITLLAQINRDEADCGMSAHLITLDSDGTLLSDRRRCSVAITREVSGTSADAAGGILVRLGSNLMQLSPDARRRWQYPQCPLCADSDSGSPIGMHLYADGSAWVTPSKWVPAVSGIRRYFRRLGADGSTLSETEMPASGGGVGHRSVLLADADRAIDISAHAVGLRWSRVSAAGVLLESREVSLPGSSDNVQFFNSRLWPDGSVSLLVSRRNSRGCQISPPSPISCTPSLTTLVRLNANGSERWRVELGQDWPLIGFNDDGSSLAFSNAFEQAPRSMRIAADGSAGPAQPIGGLAYDGWFAVAGPARGKYLLATLAMQYLTDDRANVLATRPSSSDACCIPLAAGEYGFLMASDSADAALLSPDDLSLTARFDMDGAPDIYLPFDSTFWHLLDDGSIYTSASRTGDYPLGGRLSRFAVPGSPAHDQVFIDRFD